MKRKTEWGREGSSEAVFRLRWFTFSFVCSKISLVLSPSLSLAYFHRFEKYFPIQLTFSWCWVVTPLLCSAAAFISVNRHQWTERTELLLNASPKVQLSRRRWKTLNKQINNSNNLLLFLYWRFACWLCVFFCCLCCCYLFKSSACFSLTIVLLNV